MLELRLWHLGTSFSYCHVRVLLVGYLPGLFRCYCLRQLRAR